MAFDVVLLMKVVAFVGVTTLFLLVAHVLWIAQLARSSALRSCSAPVRAAILVLAALTPLVSYYVVSTVRRAKDPGKGVVRRFAPVTLLAGFAVAAALSLVIEYRFDERAMNWDRGTSVIALNRSVGIGFFLLVLFMIVRVFWSLSPRRSTAYVAIITLMLLASIVLLLS